MYMLCALPHLAENCDSFVLVEEPHNDTNILFLKRWIEVQLRIVHTAPVASFLFVFLSTPLPSSPLPDPSFPSLYLSLFLLLSSHLYSTIPPLFYALNTLMSPTSLLLPLPLLFLILPLLHLNLSQWDLRIICETPGDQLLLLLTIVTIVGSVVEFVVLCAKVFHRLVMWVCMCTLFV